MDYLLPTEYVNTMKILHNQAPESDVEELFETVETDLNCKVRRKKWRNYLFFVVKFFELR